MSKKQKRVCWITASVAALMVIVGLGFVVTQTACSTNTKSSGGNAINTDNRATGLFGGSKYTVEKRIYRGDNGTFLEVKIKGSPATLVVSLTGDKEGEPSVIRKDEMITGIGKTSFRISKSGSFEIRDGERTLTVKTVDPDRVVWESKVVLGQQGAS